MFELSCVIMLIAVDQSHNTKEEELKLVLRKTQEKLCADLVAELVRIQSFASPQARITDDLIALFASSRLFVSTDKLLETNRAFLRGAGIFHAKARKGLLKWSSILTQAAVAQAKKAASLEPSYHPTAIEPLVVQACQRYCSTQHISVLNSLVVSHLLPIGDTPKVQIMGMYADYFTMEELLRSRGTLKSWCEDKFGVRGFPEEWSKFKVHAPLAIVARTPLSPKCTKPGLDSFSLCDWLQRVCQERRHAVAGSGVTSKQTWKKIVDDDGKALPFTRTALIPETSSASADGLLIAVHENSGDLMLISIVCSISRDGELDNTKTEDQHRKGLLENAYSSQENKRRFVNEACKVFKHRLVIHLEIPRNKNDTVLYKTECAVEHDGAFVIPPTAAELQSNDHQVLQRACVRARLPAQGKGINNDTMRQSLRELNDKISSGCRTIPFHSLYICDTNYMQFFSQVPSFAEILSVYASKRTHPTANQLKLPFVPVSPNIVSTMGSAILIDDEDSVMDEKTQSSNSIAPSESLSASQGLKVDSSFDVQDLKMSDTSPSVSRQAAPTTGKLKQSSLQFFPARRDVVVIDDDDDDFAFTSPSSVNRQSNMTMTASAFSRDPSSRDSSSSLFASTTRTRRPFVSIQPDDDDEDFEPAPRRSLKKHKIQENQLPPRAFDSDLD